MKRAKNTCRKPHVAAVTFCQNVIRDEATKMPSLIGVFDQIKGRRLPIRYERMHVFVSLLGGRGKCPFSLRCRAQDGSPLFEARGETLFKGALGSADVNIEITDLLFAAEGDYVVELYCCGELAMARPLSVVLED